MTMLTWRQFAQGAVALTRAAAVSVLPQAKQALAPAAVVDSDSLPPPDPLYLLLSRTSFGISDEDFAHAQSVGFASYVDEQLNPDSIDDSAVEAFFAENFPFIFLPQPNSTNSDKRNAGGQPRN